MSLQVVCDRETEPYIEQGFRQQSYENSLPYTRDYSISLEKMGGLSLKRKPTGVKKLQGHSIEGEPAPKKETTLEEWPVAMDFSDTDMACTSDMVECPTTKLPNGIDIPMFGLGEWFGVK